MSRFAPPRAELTSLDGGGWILRSLRATQELPSQLGDLVRRQPPERPLLVEPDGESAHTLTYGEARARADWVSQALLDRELGPERPVMILSGNGITHAVLSLAAMQVGIPVVPVSPAYSLLSSDFARLRFIVNLVQPGLVFASDGQTFEPALRAIARPGLEPVVARDPAALPHAEPRDVEPAYRLVNHDTVAKILFTSGSTGEPKGVLNTQRMLLSNQDAIAQLWPFLGRRPPVLVDWLPWHHTFGGNHNFNLVLWHGGTLHLDPGRPTPDLIFETERLLRQVSPTVYFNVPAGYGMLVPRLERDSALRDRFFADLDTLFYAAAALPPDLWRRLEALSLQARGEIVPLTSAWGATETAPMVTAVHYPVAEAGNIGLPGPGTAVKAVPVRGKLELRVKGPGVTPGYFRDPERTEAAFDENGWLRTGDAGRLEDPDDPSKGLRFDGRISEDFKLTTGTWVHPNAVRMGALGGMSPVASDALVAGEGRDEIGLLIWPNVDEVRALAGLRETAPLAEVLAHPAVRARVVQGVRQYNAGVKGSSARVARALFLVDPPSLDAGEITDKGYVNQQAGLARRESQVERLYSDDPAVITP